MNTNTLDQEMELAHQEELEVIASQGLFTVISTQCRENYGAHDWDGEGKCPQYWKNKGGSTFICEGELTSSQIDYILDCINCIDDYTEEYAVNITTTKTPKDCYEHWETPSKLSFNEEGVLLLSETNYTGTYIFELHPDGMRNLVK